MPSTTFSLTRRRSTVRDNANGLSDRSSDAIIALNLGKGNIEYQ
jgi:hypothetical protein